MISFFEAALDTLSIHRIGNKLQDEHYILSDAPVSIQDEQLGGLLMHYFVNPYGKINEVYHFYHSSGDLNLKRTISRKLSLAIRPLFMRTASR